MIKKIMEKRGVERSSKKQAESTLESGAEKRGRDNDGLNVKVRGGSQGESQE